MPEFYGIVDKFLTFWGIIFLVLLVLILVGVIAALVYYQRKDIKIEEARFILGWTFGINALFYLGRFGLPDLE